MIPLKWEQLWPALQGWIGIKSILLCVRKCAEYTGKLFAYTLFRITVVDVEVIGVAEARLDGTGSAMTYIESSRFATINVLTQV